MADEAQMRKRKTEEKSTLPTHQSHYVFADFTTTRKCPRKTTGNDKGANQEIAAKRIHRHRIENMRDQANRGYSESTLRGSNSIGTPQKKSHLHTLRVVNRSGRDGGSLNLEPDMHTWTGGGLGPRFVLHRNSERK
jgi:hypothetical protein